jgi:hypothetical protein
MRLHPIHGVVAVVAFSVPAFASTGETRTGLDVPHVLGPNYLQVATSLDEDGPLVAAFDIFERLRLQEAANAVREGGGRADRLSQIGNPNVPEEEADDNFQCAVMSAAGVPIKCIRYLP